MESACIQQPPHFVQAIQPGSNQQSKGQAQQQYPAAAAAARAAACQRVTGCLEGRGTTAAGGIPGASWAAGAPGVVGGVGPCEGAVAGLTGDPQEALPIVITALAS